MADYERRNTWLQLDLVQEALWDFREAAETATVAWGQDVTTLEGLGIVQMLGAVIEDFRAVTGCLSRYKVTADPGDNPDAPNHEIWKASQCLNAAMALARVPEQAMKPAIRPSPESSPEADGDPDADSPTAAAVRGMLNTLGASDGIWLAPAGPGESRYEVVTQTMHAMDAFGTSVLTLAREAPEPLQMPLIQIAIAFDASIGHLRESLVISATGNYQPGTEWIADAVRAAYPLRFKHRPAPGHLASAGAQAASLAAESFPAPLADAPASLPPAAPGGPDGTAAVRRPAAGRSHAARKAPR